jgi:hypothetical protein
MSTKLDNKNTWILAVACRNAEIAETLYNSFLFILMRNATYTACVRTYLCVCEFIWRVVYRLNNGAENIFFPTDSNRELRITQTCMQEILVHLSTGIKKQGPMTYYTPPSNKKISGVLVRQ